MPISISVFGGVMANDISPTQLVGVATAETQDGSPRKRRGEHFGEWWLRISDAEAHGVTRASRVIGVTPRSVFEFYTRYEDEA